MLRFPNTIARRACSKTHRTQGRQLCASSRETNNSAQRSNKHNSYAIRAMASRRRRAACRNECAGRWKCVIAQYTTVTRRITHVLLRQLVWHDGIPCLRHKSRDYLRIQPNKKNKTCKESSKDQKRKDNSSTSFRTLCGLSNISVLGKRHLDEYSTEGELET
jgi:hypothetical protein